MKRWILITLTLFALVPVKAGNAAEVTYARYAATCMYSFLRYIEWPGSSGQGQFNIAIVGDNEVYEEIKKLVDGRKIGVLSYKVVFLKKIEEINSSFQMVFIDELQTYKLKKLTEEVLLTSSLLITESPGATKKGAMVNFVNDNGKVKFEMSTNNITSNGMKVSSSLNNLAILVD